LSKLENDGYDLTIEDKGNNLFGFLGIEINRKGKQIEVTQTGLIDKVIKYCNMDNTSSKTTPAATTPLGTDKFGEPFNEEWSYPAAVGMLLYLSFHTRPDIQFAVHQGACISHCPRKSHAQAVKPIVRYLIGARKRGTMFQPDLSKGLDCYVDACQAMRMSKTLSRSSCALGLLSRCLDAPSFGKASCKLRLLSAALPPSMLHSAWP
jgi:hypothetical protein